MADYKTIKGLFIKIKDADPVADRWAGSAWATGGSLSRATRAPAGGGTNTAAIMSGGTAPNNHAPAQTGSEEYDGSSWTAAGTRNNGVWGTASVGTQTAFNTFAGYNGSARTNVSESYDGTTWTSITNYPQTTSDAHGAGTQTASLINGGLIGTPAETPWPAPNWLNTTNEWDGTSYSAGGSLNQGRYLHGSTGTQTAALAAGGKAASQTPSSNVEEYDGTSWTEVTNLPANRDSLVAGGIQTAGIIMGGELPSGAPNVAQASSYSYDGTNWTAAGDMIAGVYQGGASKTAANSSMIVFGGQSNIPLTTLSSATYELSAPADFDAIVEGELFFNTTAGAIKANKLTFAAGSWASGGSLNSGHQYMGTAGVSDTSALIFSGTLPVSGATESYDGSTWTEVNDMSTGRGYLGGGAGTQTAAIAVGGSSPTVPATSGATEIWDGTNWTTAPSLTRGAVAPQSTVYGSTTGVTTSALYIGGGEGTGTNTLTLTEAYNGTSWTEVGDLTTAVSYGAGIGKSDTDALLVTGINWVPGSSVNSDTNMYFNGTSWTELANANTPRGFAGGATYGSSTAALIFGGRNQGPSALYTITEQWNGTSWTEVADLGTARFTQGGSGTSANAIYAGGNPYITNTEEWTQPSSVLVKSVTVS